MRMAVVGAAMSALFIGATATAQRAELTIEDFLGPSKWQAVIASPDTFYIAMTTDHPNAEAAKAELHADCASDGISGCVVISLTNRQCAAAAYNESKRAYFGGVGPTRQDALASAYEQCASRGEYCNRDMVGCPSNT